jgi:hypothetical protein
LIATCCVVDRFTHAVEHSDGAGAIDDDRVGRAEEQPEDQPDGHSDHDSHAVDRESSAESVQARAE